MQPHATVRYYHLKYLFNDAERSILSDPQLKLLNDLQNAKKWRPKDNRTKRFIEKMLDAGENDPELQLFKGYSLYSVYVIARYKNINNILVIKFNAIDPKYDKGIPLLYIRKFLTNPKYFLYPVPEEFNKKPDETVPFIEKLLPIKEELEEELMDLSEIKPYNLPEEYFYPFTFDEICKLYYSSVIQMRIEQWFVKSASRDRLPEPKIPYKIFHKLESSQHQYGYTNDWNGLVSAYYQLADFDLNLPDFSVTLDMTEAFKAFGSSEYTNTYLDGPMGYLIHYKGIHVLTIGFTLSYDFKLLINQVQVKSKKGKKTPEAMNARKWLYKLPRPYLEYIIDRMRVAFPNFELYLVEGVSLADRIKRSYGPDLKNWDPTTYPRIISFYNKPLNRYQRGESIEYRELKFDHLIPINSDDASRKSLPTPAPHAPRAQY